jgi:hypothetical protein
MDLNALMYGILAIAILFALGMFAVTILDMRK